MSTAAEMSPRANFVLMVISDGCKDLSSCAATPQRPGLFRSGRDSFGWTE